MSAGFQSRSSSPLVTRLLDGHGVVLGKTRMHELAVGVTTINMHGGPVLNPYNNTMHTGGLSRLTLPHRAPDTALRSDICRASAGGRRAFFACFLEVSRL